MQQNVSWIQYFNTYDRHTQDAVRETDVKVLSTMLLCTIVQEDDVSRSQPRMMERRCQTVWRRAVVLATRCDWSITVSGRSRPPDDVTPRRRPPAVAMERCPMLLIRSSEVYWCLTWSLPAAGSTPGLWLSAGRWPSLCRCQLLSTLQPLRGDSRQPDRVRSPNN